MTAKPLVCDKCNVILPHPLDQAIAGYQTLSISSVVRNAQPNICTLYLLNASHVMGPAPYARILVVHRQFVPMMPLVLEPFRNSKRPYSTLVLGTCERRDRKIDRGTQDLIDFPPAPLLLDREGSPVSSRTQASCLPC
jgi:hypothetical protein